MKFFPDSYSYLRGDDVSVKLQCSLPQNDHAPPPGLAHSCSLLSYSLYIRLSPAEYFAIESIEQGKLNI